MTMSGNYTSDYSGTMPSIGARVLTLDGNELGKVKDVASGCFQVDASMQPDYWLGTGTIASSTGTEVRLSIPKDRVGDLKLDGPEQGGGSRHTS